MSMGEVHLKKFWAFDVPARVHELMEREEISASISI
jgi:hypothetical protein